MEKNLPQRIEIVGSILLCQTFCNPWGLMALNAHDIGQKEITRGEQETNDKDQTQ